MANAEQTEWRMRGASLVLRLLIVAAIGVSGIPGGVRWFAEPSSRGGLNGNLGLLGALIIVAAAGLIVVSLRTRVRLVAAGVEVRELRTRVYPWADISSADLDRFSNRRIIKLTMRDGSVRVLPVPTRGLRKLSDPTLPLAVASLNHRRSGDPGDPSGTAAVESPLDDFLHDT
jgi:hypothetical protein